MTSKRVIRNENSTDEPFELVTFGKGGEFTPFDVDKTCILIEHDDLIAWELERRRIEFQENPDEGESWEDVRKSLEDE
jgi:hypothetical protein